MNPKIDPIYVGTDAVGQMLAYVRAHHFNHFALVADHNTFRALGSRVEAALKAEGYAVTSIVLTDEEIHPDEPRLIQVLIQAPLGDCTFIAVGSGTITDITRFISHRTARSFISMPTAPSVDGFTSTGAPLILKGVKTTLFCHAPLAVFADLETLANAPQELIAAGFGDMIGKITSLADWKLGSILWNEPYDPEIARRTQAAIDSCLKHIDLIKTRSLEGVRVLMDALIESGLCMLDFGASRPASGAEHHASHYWEMKRLKEHRPVMLHGAQVGYALTLVAEQYARIRGLSRAEMLTRLEEAVLPPRDAEIAYIHDGYGELAGDIIKEHLAFIDLTEADFDALKHRIADQWDAIQAVAASVHDAQRIAGYLREVQAPADFTTLGLDRDEVQPGLDYGHYLRNRFTILKLSRVLGVPVQ